MPDRARPPHSPPLPRLLNGSARPLGATADAGGVNFAVWAPDATAVEGGLFDADGQVEQARVRLPCCTDGVWHGRLLGEGLGADTVYGLRAHGPWAPREGHRFNPARVLLDPWTQAVVGTYGGQCHRPVLFSNDPFSGQTPVLPAHAAAVEHGAFTGLHGSTTVQALCLALRCMALAQLPDGTHATLQRVLLVDRHGLETSAVLVER